MNVDVQGCLISRPMNWYEERLNELSQLPEGWHGFKGEKVTIKALMTAWHILQRAMPISSQRPNIYPTISGGIEIDWSKSDHSDSDFLVIHVSPKGTTRMSLAADFDIELLRYNLELAGFRK